MPDDGLKANLRGVAAGLLTPFEESDPDQIYREELAATASWLYEHGIRLFLASANISEYHSLSRTEREDSVRIVCEELPADATVLGGIGGSTKHAISLGRAYESAGADGIMIMPPDHTFKHERGVINYYERIAEAIDIGVVPYLYDFPVTSRLLEEVAAMEGIVGFKWAIPDVGKFSECVMAVDGDIAWLCGLAEPPAPAYYREGADGFSGGVTNFAPRLGLALNEAMEAGEWERARELRNLTYPYMNLRAECGEQNIYPGAVSVPAVKAGLEFAGRHGGPVREPLVDLCDRDRERAREMYAEIHTSLESLL